MSVFLCEILIRNRHLKVNFHLSRYKFSEFGIGKKSKTAKISIRHAKHLNVVVWQFFEKVVFCIRQFIFTAISSPDVNDVETKSSRLAASHLRFTGIQNSEYKYKIQSWLIKSHLELIERFLNYASGYMNLMLVHFFIMIFQRLVLILRKYPRINKSLFHCMI